MFKFLELIKRRPELTHEQFRNYMETRHAPFALKALNDHTLGLRRYVRNYVDQPASDDQSLITNETYDVVTEFWFNDKAAYEEFIKWHSGDLATDVRKDEDRFIDRPGTKRMFVEEIEQLEALRPVEISLPTDAKE